MLSVEREKTRRTELQFKGRIAESGLLDPLHSPKSQRCYQASYINFFFGGGEDFLS